MNPYNPYAAPQAGPPIQPMGPQYAQLGPQAWEIGEVFSLAWESFKRTWGVLVGSYFLAGIVGAVPGQIPGVLVATQSIDQGSSEYWIIYSACTFVALLIQSFFQPGLIRIWVGVARGESPDFGQLFGGASKFLPVFATLMLTLLVSLVGYVFFVVPGIILGIGLMFAQFFVVDADMGPIDGMMASWNATKGMKGKLFLFGLVSALVAMVGLVACCIGIYATLPLVWLAMSIVYVRISGRGTTSSGYAPPGYGPPGGYGAPPAGGYGAPPGGGYGGPPQGGGYGPPGGGYGGPPQGGGGGGYGGPPQGGGGGGYGGPPPGGGY